MKKPVILSILCVAASLFLLLWGFNEPSNTETPPQKKYVLLIEDDTGTFLMQLRKGLQEGAAQQDARLAVETAGPDPRAQANDLAAQGYSAALLLLSDPAPMLAACAESGVPTLVVGQSIRGQVCVLSSDETAGQLLMHRALTLSPDHSRVALLTSDSDSHAKARGQGAEALGSRYTVSSLPWQGDLAALTGYQVLVAADPAQTILLADAKRDGLLPASLLVLGVDTGDRRVTDLESGLVTAMVMDSPYAMGYLALEKARLLAQGDLSPSIHTVTPTLIDLKNMYLAENVKMVFPLLQ